MPVKGPSVLLTTARLHQPTIRGLAVECVQLTAKVTELSPDWSGRRGGKG